MSDLSPRQWGKGDPEPEGVEKVRDCQDRVWKLTGRPGPYPWTINGHAWCNWDQLLRWEPLTELLPEPAEPANVLSMIDPGDECQDVRCSRIDGRCVGYHCSVCGKPCSMLGHADCRAQAGDVPTVCVPPAVSVAQDVTNRSSLVSVDTGEESNAMQMFQEDGESWRALFGIDGTAGDAQDVPHPFVPESPGGCCAACGLAGSYSKHTEDWTKPPTSSADTGTPIQDDSGQLRAELAKVVDPAIWAAELDEQSTIGARYQWHERRRVSLLHAERALTAGWWPPQTGDEIEAAELRIKLAGLVPDVKQWFTDLRVKAAGDPSNIADAAQDLLERVLLLNSPPKILWEQVEQS